MALQPSRRDVLVGTGGLLVGAAGGVLASSLMDGKNGTADRTASVPLAWADTEWPFPHYDPARTRHPPPESTPPNDLTRAWELRDETVFGDTWAPPVVANGRVFTAAGAERGTSVWALDVDTGDVDWKLEFLGEGGMDPELAVPGDGVYYRIDGGEVPLGQFGASSGDVVWGDSNPPLGGWTVGGGRLYYGDRGDGTLRTYDARTGEQRWTTAVDDERLVAQSYHPEFGVFATALGTLYALDPEDGSVLWDRPVSKHTKSGPVVAGGRAFVTKWTDGMDLLALDPESGDELWRYPLSPTKVSDGDKTFRRYYDLGAATPEIVVVREHHADPSPEALHAVDATSGDRLWRIRPPEGTSDFSDVTVVDGAVYVSATGDENGELLRLALSDGSRMDAWPLPDGAAAPLVADGRVVVGTRNGLVAFA